MYIFITAVLAILQSAPASQSRVGEDRAEALLQEVIAATRRVTTVRARLRIRDETPGTTEWTETPGTLRLKRPFFARLDLELPGSTYGPRPQALAADGMRLWLLHPDPDGPRYSESPVDRHGAALAASSILLVDFWCDPRRERILRWPGIELRLAGTRTVDGADHRVLAASGGDRGLKWSCELFVGKDGLVRHAEETFESLVKEFGPDGKKEEIRRMRTTVVFEDCVVGTPMTAAEFAWQPPEGASSRAATAIAPTSLMLEPGEAAPDLVVPLRAGGTASLARLREGGKPALLVFWSCVGGGLDVLPAVARLRVATRDQGLAVLTVNVGDTRKIIDRFLTDGSPGVDIGLSEDADAEMAIRREWAIHGGPAVYLVDAQGKIAWRAHGWTDSAVREALAKAVIR